MRQLIILGAVVISMVVIIGCSSDSRKEQVAEAKKAQPIVKAIYQFHRDKGEYPKSLDSLDPAYFPKSVINSIGSGWEYSLFGTNGFRLSKRPQDKKWRVHYWESGLYGSWMALHPKRNLRELSLPDMKTEVTKEKILTNKASQAIVAPSAPQPER